MIGIGMGDVSSDGCNDVLAVARNPDSGFGAPPIRLELSVLLSDCIGKLRAQSINPGEFKNPFAIACAHLRPASAPDLVIAEANENQRLVQLWRQDVGSNGERIFNPVQLIPHVENPPGFVQGLAVADFRRIGSDDAAVLVGEGPGFSGPERPVHNDTAAET